MCVCGGGGGGWWPTFVCVFDIYIYMNCLAKAYSLIRVSVSNIQNISDRQIIHEQL